MFVEKVKIGQVGMALFDGDDWEVENGGRGGTGHFYSQSTSLPQWVLMEQQAAQGPPKETGIMEGFYH